MTTTMDKLDVCATTMFYQSSMGKNMSPRHIQLCKFICYVTSLASMASVDNLVVVDVVVEKGQPSTEGEINDYTKRHDEIAGWLRWMWCDVCFVYYSYSHKLVSWTLTFLCVFESTCLLPPIHAHRQWCDGTFLCSYSSLVCVRTIVDRRECSCTFVGNLQFWMSSFDTGSLIVP